MRARIRETGMFRGLLFAAPAASPSGIDSGVAPRVDTGRRIDFQKILRLAACCFQLALILLVIREYQLESRTFFNVMALAACGFVVHALLPMQHRLPFFVALSLAGIVVAFGPWDGSCLILLTLAPIAICHLRASFGLRVGLLLAAGAVFALWRAEILRGPWSTAIWPILGSMLMFRLALYMYALKHDQMRPTVSSTLAYFFMLPNVCFPLFPVIDYSTFRRTYYDIEPDRIYTTGIKWIVRGLVHLILYRVVYVHLVGDPMDVQTLGQLVQFLLATFLLYLRVSGQFHLIVGFLHLFGFRLPETHHLYYLASSFSDFWRRINIYWKDFMMRLVYYPSFFGLKRFGPKAALVGATIVVFAATWVLHSYQWFWLRGGFPLTAQDGLFWGLLGVLVIHGALRELSATRKRKLGRSKKWSFSLALRTVGTFTAICVLWSLWSAESMATWMLMWGAAAKTSARELLVIGALIAGGIAIAGREWEVSEKKATTGVYPYFSYNLFSAGFLVALLLLSSTTIYEKASPQMASLVSSVQRTTLNARDEEQQHKGYYEKLDNSSRMSAQLWEMENRKPSHWVPLSSTPVYQTRRDFLGVELKPSMSITFMDHTLTTNSFGMRDRERSLTKPAGTYRIAVLGPSLVMGSGVADASTFPRLLEETLNQSADRGVRFEVLNFGISALALTQQLAMLNDRVLRFQPDAVFLTDGPTAGRITRNHLVGVAAQSTSIPFKRVRDLVQETGITALGNSGLPVLFDTCRSLLARAGVKTRMPWTEADHRMRRAGDRAVQAAFDEIADLSKRNGVVPVFVALHTVGPAPDEPFPALQAAASSGMLVFNLLAMWEGQDLDTLRVGIADHHANETGSQLIAARLRDLINTHSAELRLK
jgi:D-alanyl-lipoteichoic acid acyltransferase DltB (MBOAT superfamily)